jgi:prepilin-type N-terminal cleavage/methylation domain-containing protein
MKSKNAWGFTFIEVLVSLALVALVLSLGYFSLVYSARFSREARLKTYREHEIMKVFAQMRGQLLNAYVNPNFTYNLIGLKTKEVKQDALYFLTSSLLHYSTVGEAGYKIIKQGDQKVLAYREYPYPVKAHFTDDFIQGWDDEDSHQTSSNDINQPKSYKWVPLARDINGMEIEYYRGELPMDDWKTADLPDKITITLWYKDQPEDSKYSFTMVPGLKSSFW